MTTRILVEILVILLLLGANGIFAMAEMAVVSSRKTRLKALAEKGSGRARLALELAESPDRFLPTVQVGITLIGLLAGAFGGITIAEQVAAAVKAIPLLASSAEVIGVAVVVSGMTFLSLIIGELVPKRLALADPEAVAVRFARPIFWFSRLAGPPVRILSSTTNLILRLLNARPQKIISVSEEEVKLMVQEGTQAGIFHATEPGMVESVLALDRLAVRKIMTPRRRMVWLRESDPQNVTWRKIVSSGHSYYPVLDSAEDRLRGVASVKAVYANLAAGAPVALTNLMVAPLVVAGECTVTHLLELFKASGQRLAVICEPHGAVAGLITLVDVLEAIVGDLPSASERLTRRQQICAAAAAA